MLVPTDPSVIGMYLRLYKDCPYRGLAELVLSVPELVTSLKNTSLGPLQLKGHSVKFAQTLRCPECCLFLIPVRN